LALAVRRRPTLPWLLVGVYAVMVGITAFALILGMTLS
jgi:hypothetical protein